MCPIIARPAPQGGIGWRVPRKIDTIMACPMGVFLAQGALTKIREKEGFS